MSNSAQFLDLFGNSLICLSVDIPENQLGPQFGKSDIKKKHSNNASLPIRNLSKNLYYLATVTVTTWTIASITGLELDLACKSHSCAATYLMAMSLPIPLPAPVMRTISRSRFFLDLNGLMNFQVASKHSHNTFIRPTRNSSKMCIFLLCRWAHWDNNLI